MIGLKSRFQTTSLTFSYHIDFVCRNPLNFNFRNPGIMLCICNFVVSLDDLVNNRRVQLRRTFRRSGIHTHHLALYQFIYNLIQTVQLIHIQRPLSPPPLSNTTTRPVGLYRLLHHQQQRQAAGLVTMHMHNICSHCTGHKRIQSTTPPPDWRFLQRHQNSAAIHRFNGVAPPNALVASPHGNVDCARNDPAPPPWGRSSTMHQT